jgi:hypothetical protein
MGRKTMQTTAYTNLMLVLITLIICGAAFGQEKPTVARLIDEGYEIRAVGAGGEYNIVLQKDNKAYLCRHRSGDNGVTGDIIRRGICEPLHPE